MSLLDSIHESWNPIKYLLYEEPLNTLRQKILPNISYQPKRDNIFRVLKKPLSSYNVVILGQDPYPTPGDAIGRAFGVSSDRKIPKSLKIIETELNNCLNTYELQLSERNENWKTLEHLENQGVLLLNTALTVESGRAGSHLNYWRNFTERIINYISVKQPCIWLIWGRKAESFVPYISNRVMVNGYNEETIKEIPASIYNNYVLVSPHPAAEVYTGNKGGFYGNKHFIFTNEILKLQRKPIIYW